MKRFPIVLIIALWSTAASAQSIGLFTDPLGTDCNLAVPYPGGPVTAYVVATLDGAAGAGATGAALRIAGLPEGWTGTAAPAGPVAPSVVGDPFGLGVALAYPTCMTGRLVLLTLSITPASAVENASLVVLPHADAALSCCAALAGGTCSEPCALFCGCGDCRIDCRCAVTTPATINGPPCVVAATDWTWGKAKSTYR